MVQRCSNPAAFLVLEPEPSIRTGIRVDIYDGADPATLLAVLEDTWARSWTEPLQGTGSGTFKVHADHPKLVANPDLLAYGNIARFNLDEVDRFAITIEKKDLVQASAGGDGERALTVSGRGLLAKLEEAVAYPQTGLGGNPIRGFAGIAPGHLSRVLIDEAIARGALTGVVRTYTDTDDSNNAPWAVTLDQTERAGTDLLRIHERMAATAVDVYMKPDLSLWMVNERGIDRTLQLPDTGPVILQVADSITDLERSEEGSIRNALLIESPGGFLERSDGASITEHRRREAFLSLGNISQTDGVDRAAAHVFQRSANPAADIATEVLDADGKRPYVDWGIGDWILFPDADNVLTKLRVRSLTVSETQDGRPRFVPELATVTEELEDRLERWLAAMQKGTVGGTASAVAEPVNAPVEVVEAVDSGITNHLAIQPHPDELNDLVDVDLTGLSDGDMLWYKTSSGAWIPVDGTQADGKVPTVQADGSIAWEAPPGAGSVPPAWMIHLETRDDTPHADDDEFNGSGVGVPAGWTEVLPAGSATHTKKRGVLSTLYQSQAANDLAALMKAIASGTNVVIETAARQLSYSENYYMHGLVFSIGTTTTSAAIWLMYWNTTIELRSGTFTNINVDHNSPGLVLTGFGNALHYLRMEYDQTSGFRVHWSSDGISWVAGPFVANPLGGAPTHMGLGHTTWGGGNPKMVTREYFRVNPA